MATPLGKPFDCKNCGIEVQWAVSKSNRKYLAQIKRWHGDDASVELAFYPSHQCDPNLERVAERLAMKQSLLEARLAQGDLIKGQTVTVIKGRKVAKGTTGVIFWLQENPYSTRYEVERVGIKDANGQVHYTSATNVVATNQMEASK